MFLYKNFKLLFFAFSLVCLSSLSAIANSNPVVIGGSDNLLDGYVPDVPSSMIDCDVGGSLDPILMSMGASIRLMSAGNAVVSDTTGRTIQVFERAQVGQTMIEIVIRIPGIDKDKFTKFVITKDPILSDDAEIVLAIRIPDRIGMTDETYLYNTNSGSMPLVNPVSARITGRLNKTQDNGQDFITVTGRVMITLPEQPKKIDSMGNFLPTVFEPGYINCSATDLPISSNDLTTLEAGFDRDLANEIRTEAGTMVLPITP